MFDNVNYVCVEMSQTDADGLANRGDPNLGMHFHSCDFTNIPHSARDLLR